MGAVQEEVLAPYPGGFPYAVVAGRSLAFGIFIPGKPVHKDRPRVKLMPPQGGQHNAKAPCGWAQFYTPAATEAYEKHVGETALYQLRSLPEQFFLPIEESRLIVSLRFNLPRPATVKRAYPTVKPDLDNLEKAIYDGLVKYGVLKDDAPITDHMVCKRYADFDHPEGVEIEITCLAL